MPLDQDSRLELLRVEWPAGELKPILHEHTAQVVDSLLEERRSESALAAEGIVPSRSVLLVGPPGVGKTLTARWLASQLQLPLMTLDLAAVMSSYLGKTGNNLRAVLDYAKEVECILLLDEFDAVAKRRDDAAEIGELKRLVTVLLQEVDLWPPTGLLIAATNHPELLDPAIWRRFDVVAKLALPDVDQISDFLHAKMRDSDQALGDALGNAFVGYSYSDIDRTIQQCRRRSVLTRRPFAEVLVAHIADDIRARSRTDRIGVAMRLAATGRLSHREISSLTGVSRDTLRKRERA